MLVISPFLDSLKDTLASPSKPYDGHDSYKSTLQEQKLSKYQLEYRLIEVKETLLFMEGTNVPQSVQNNIHDNYCCL